MAKLTFAVVKSYPSCAVMLMTGFTCPAFSVLVAERDVYNFNDSFLIGNKEPIDLARFSTDAISEGIYSIDVYTNNSWKGRHEMNIARRLDNQKLGVCYSAIMLEKFGISANKLNAALAKKNGFCGYLSQWRQDADISDTFNIGELRMDISVPQMYEDRMYVGYVSPELWQPGIPALNLSYMANYYNNHNSSQDYADISSSYLGINSGLSYGGWLLKYVGNMNTQQGQGIRWQNNQTYLQRPLPKIKSVATGGQFFSSGEFFESVGLRGLRLATDDNMFPDGMRSYAPEIRGVAMSNALVTVRQNNAIIYQTQVSPGPFNINDVYPSGFGNDLEVTVKEADGSVRQFNVPYSSVSQLLRPGMGRYNVIVGTADDERLRNRPTLFQGYYQYGVNNMFTGYTGLTAFEGYQAYLLGSGLNTVVGAVSLDAIQSNISLDGNEWLPKKARYSGQSYRLTFNRMFDSTKTSVVLAAYRYSTQDYYSINDALQAIDNAKQGNISTFAREKNGFSYTLNQDLPNGWGGLYFNGRISNYWNRTSTEKQYQLSYNTMWDRLSYSVSLQRYYAPYLGNRGQENRASLNFSYPLSFGERNSASITGGSTFTDSRFNNAQIGLNGAFGSENDFSYGINQSASRGGNHSLALNGSYRTPDTTLSGSYGQGHDYRQVGVSASGSLIAHQGGITLSPETGSTLALIEAQGAQGANLPGAPGTRIDSRGYAILPYLRPYRINTVEIDPKGANEDIVFDKTVANIVPYENSVVRVNFATRIEKNLTFRAVMPDGKALPFGADIVNEQGERIGVVGQGSLLFINDDQASRVWVRWARGQCSVNLKNALEQEAACR